MATFYTVEHRCKAGLCSETAAAGVAVVLALQVCRWVLTDVTGLGVEVTAEGRCMAWVTFVTDVAADRSAQPGVAPRVVGLTEWGLALSHHCLSVPLSVPLPSTASPFLPLKICSFAPLLCVCLSFLMCSLSYSFFHPSLPCLSLSGVSGSCTRTESKGMKARVISDAFVRYSSPEISTN